MSYLPPVSSAVLDEGIVLQAPDGPMGAFVARPDASEPRPGVLVLIEAFGLVGSIKDFAHRLAAAGYVAIVPDLFYREAPDNTAGYDDIATGMDLQAKLVARGGRFLGDASVALDWLDASPEVAPGRQGVVGFCMGGSLTFATAAGLAERVGAAACFYGAGISNLIPRAGAITARLMLAYGGRDPYIPPDEVAAVRAGLETAGTEFDLHIYPDADHGFMNDARPQAFHPEAADEAWARLLAFFGSALGGPAR